jgi:HEAT repeat protein
MAISFSCGTCGKPYKVDERFAGKKAKCRGCGAINKIPAGNEPHARPGLLEPLATVDDAADDAALPLAGVEEEIKFESALSEAAAAEESLELAEDPDIAPPPQTPPRIAPRRVVPIPDAPVDPTPALPVNGCPMCGRPLEDGSVLCTECGFNRRTGQRVSTAVEPDDDLDELEEQGINPHAVRAPNPGLRKMARLLIIAGVTVSLLSTIGLAARPLASLGSILPVLGALSALIGAVIFFIDGAWQWGAAGVGATVLSLIVLIGMALHAESVAVAAEAARRQAQADADAAARAAAMPKPVIKIDLGPKVAMITPGKYSIRAPAPDDDPVDYWKPVLTDGDPEIRAIVIDRLAGVPEGLHGGAVDAIADVAADENVKVRRAAMSNLALTKTAKGVAAAIKGLDDPDRTVVLSALKVLTQYKDESAVDPLLAKVNTLGDPALVALAAHSKVAPAKLAEGYKQIVQQAPDPKLRPAILERIVELDPANAGPMLTMYVADAELDLRTLAMQHLAELKYAPAAEPIAERLRDDSITAAAALTKIGAPAEAPAAAKLKDGDAQIRLVAISILKEIGTQESLPVIKAAARDADFAVAMAARDVWRKLEPDALPPVNEALMDLGPLGGNAGNGPEKQFIVRAITTIKDMPVDDARQTALSRRLYELMMGGGESPIPVLACDALMTWADKATKDKVIEAIKNEGDDTKRALVARLAVEFKDVRAVRPLCECLAQGRDLPNTMDALREFGTSSEEYLIRLIVAGDVNSQTNACSLLREIGTRRCFMSLNALANNKNIDQQMRKRAKETMIAINRRLNTAAYRASAAKRAAAAAAAAAATQPATTQPSQPAATTQATTQPAPAAAPTAPATRPAGRIGL